MDKQNQTEINQKLIAFNLELHAITQDILNCKGSQSDLDALNLAGREKILAFKRCIEDLEEVATSELDKALSQKASIYREQFTKSLQAFRKANIQTMLAIEKQDRSDLFSSNAQSDASVRKRASGKSGSVVTQNENITEKMLSVSRHLSETTSKSAATLEALASSSLSVQQTNEELHNTAGSISQSGKLLKKYGRRECTDKVLLFGAFIFFLASVFYIVQKRLF